MTQPLGSSRRLAADLPVFHDPDAQHRAKQLQDRLVADPQRHS
jgi:hypothetical protein